MKTIAIIPARSGSKGLPDKNILPLGGKPLLAYSIEAARTSGLFDVIHVSTDSEHYADIARQYGADVPFLRSAETSSDTASSWDMVQEVLERYAQLGNTFDAFMLLQPTSPLRTSEDIRSAFRLMDEKHAHAVVGVCEVDHSPLWCNTLPESQCMDGFLSNVSRAPRQALPTYYRINGAIYLSTVPAFRKAGAVPYDAGCYALVMPRDRSIDIDSRLDFQIAEAILSAK